MSLEIFIPKRFYHFSCKHPFFRFFYKKVYKIDGQEINPSYHRFVGVFLFVFVTLICLTTGLQIYEITVPTERNLGNIVQKADHTELSYYGKNLILLYKTEEKPLEEIQYNEVILHTKEIKIGFYKWFPNHPKVKYTGGLSFNYDFDVPKFVELLLFDKDNEKLGSIKMFSEDQAYYVNNQNLYAKLNGDYTELYQYLTSLKTVGNQ